MGFERVVEVRVGEGSEALIVSGVYIQFSLTIEGGPSPARGTVDLYNLAPDSEERILARYQRCQVLAGYRTGGVKLLYDGVVRQVSRRRQGQDRITQLALGPPLVAAQISSGTGQDDNQAVFSRSYSGAVATRQIARDIIAALGLQVGDLDLIPAEAQEEDYSHSGPATQALTVLVLPHGLTWTAPRDTVMLRALNTQLGDGSSQPAEPQLVAKQERSRITHEVSQATGMVGSPEVTDDGLRVTTLLAPQVDILDGVRVESSVASGTYRVASISHNGSNRDGQFYTTMELRP